MVAGASCARVGTGRVTKNGAAQAGRNRCASRHRLLPRESSSDRKARGHGAGYTGESTERTGESTERTGESTERTGESTERTGESTERTGESTERESRRVPPMCASSCGASVGKSKIRRICGCAQPPARSGDIMDGQTLRHRLPAHSKRSASLSSAGAEAWPVNKKGS
ncbi:hypothetical protein DFH06DRAFT_1439470 [Mycena polygramma]|nr:hypothetical protein DFH06DRAFT_1439470 [Mycena polygramma]